MFILLSLLFLSSVSILSIWSVFFQVGNGSKVNGIQDVDLRVKSVTLEAGGCSTDAARDTLREEKVDGETLQDPLSDSKEEMNDSDWEDGSIPNSDFTGNQEVTIEFDETPDSVKRKPVRRATAEDKVRMHVA